MRLWGYYAFHTFINTIKKIFKNAFLAVLALSFAIMIVMAVIGGVVGLTMAESGVIDDTEVSETEMTEKPETEIFSFEIGGASDEAGASQAVESAEESTEDERGLVDILFGDEKGKQVKVSGPAIFELMLMFVLIFFIMWGIYSGTKKGADIFILADVNLLFTAPMKQQSVMMFRLALNLAGAIVASIYLIFQIPNLVINFKFNAFGIVALFIGWIMLLILSRLISVFTYSVGSAYPSLKKLAIPIVFIIAAVTILPGAYIYTTSGENLAEVFNAYTSDWLRFIPLVGWYKAMVGTALEGQVAQFLIYAGLMLVAFAVMIWVIWNIKTDFYEECLAGAKTRQENLEKKKNTNSTKEPKKSNKKQKMKKEMELKGQGAWVFFFRELHIYRRFSYLGIVSNTMLFYTVSVLLATIFFYRVGNFTSFMITVVVIFSIIYFKSLGNPLGVESNTIWLTLSPDNAYKKVFAILLADTAKTAIEVAPAVIGTAIFAGANIIEVVLWYLTFLAIDFMLNSVRSVLEALVPAKGMDTVKSMIQITLKIMVLMFVIIAFAAGFFVGGMYGAIVGGLLIAAVFGGISFWLYTEIM